MRKRFSLERVSSIAVSVAILSLIAATTAPGAIDAYGMGYGIYLGIAACIAAACVAVIVGLSVLSKRQTGQYPKELTTVDGYTPLGNLRWAALTAWSALFIVLGEIPSAKPALAFIVPGVNLSLLFFWTICLYPHVIALGTDGWRADFRMGIFVFATLAVATGLYASAYDLVVGAVSPYAAWAAAMIEASILVPVIRRVARAIEKWAQREEPNAAPGGPRLVIPGRPD